MSSILRVCIWRPSWILGELGHPGRAHPLHMFIHIISSHCAKVHALIQRVTISPQNGPKGPH